jgi:hypothetical protein
MARPLRLPLLNHDEIAMAAGADDADTAAADHLNVVGVDPASAINAGKSRGPNDAVAWIGG